MTPDSGKVEEGRWGRVGRVYVRKREGGEREKGEKKDERKGKG